MHKTPPSVAIDLHTESHGQEVHTIQVSLSIADSYSEFPSLHSHYSQFTHFDIAGKGKLIMR